MKKLSLISKIIYLIVFSSCIQTTEKKHDTSTLIVKDSIKLIAEREATNNEVTTWNNQIDSIFIHYKIRSELTNLIDTTIDKNKQRLTQIDLFCGKNKNDAFSTDTTVKKMLDDFNKTYGRENLSAELQKVQKKLEIMYRLALTQRFLYNETSLIVPLLKSGKKTVKDKMEPFTHRYTLTYTFELIADLKRIEKLYGAI